MSTTYFIITICVVTKIKNQPSFITLFIDSGNICQSILRYT